MGARATFAVYACFIVLVAVMADCGYRGPLFYPGLALPHGDKAGHLVLYGLFAALAERAFPARTWRLGPLSVPWGASGVAAFACLEELSQLTVAGRSADVADLAVGLVGILLATLPWRPGRGRGYAAGDDQRRTPCG